MEILGADPNQVEEVRRVTRALKCTIVVSPNESTLALHVSALDPTPEAKQAAALMVAGIASLFEQQLVEMFNAQTEKIEVEHIRWGIEA